MKAKKREPNMKKVELLVGGIADIFDTYEASHAEAMIALMYMMRTIVEDAKLDPVPVAAAVATHLMLDTKKPKKPAAKKKAARK